MYVNAQYPFVLLALGLFISVTCGLAFEATLKQGVQNWSKARSGKIIEQLQGVQLTLPYLGISAGIWLFLGAGLTIFGLPGWLSIGTSLVLTLLTSGLIWAQLSQVLIQLQQGGSRALDLDVPE
ncbi:MAG: hypothetical protein SW833_22565 [Cyanobacteriota bacterium]|nr:hypothetical protein [Cyanobacteriota bacterium]